jgi:DNA repair photolyase
MSQTTVAEIEATSILNKRKRIDSWFVSRYGLNIYRGCSHACAYCDGRDERYRVEGAFGSHVAVKTNAAELLDRALDPKRERVPLKRAYIVLGGGVGDSYQPLEERYGLARRRLEVIAEYGLPVHVLTKSSLVERDFDILRRINESSGAIVSMSFSSASDEISSVFEPGASPPSARLRTLQKANDAGLATGMFLMPVIPFVTDLPNVMNRTLSEAKRSGIDFVVFGGMTLKDGPQRDHFMEVLGSHDAQLRLEYGMIYKGSAWGSATSEYYASIAETFTAVARAHGMPRRMPTRLYKDVLDENDRVVVMLDSIGALLKMEGRDAPYGYAAHSVSQLKEPLSSMRTNLRSIKGVGKVTERIILEILDTGTSSYLESLLAEREV